MGQRSLKVGDRVVCTKNDIRDPLFYGYKGIITGISEGGAYPYKIKFDLMTVDYSIHLNDEEFMLDKEKNISNLLKAVDEISKGST